MRFPFIPLKVVDNYRNLCENMAKDPSEEGFRLIAYAALIDNQADLSKYNELVLEYQNEMFRIARSILHDHHLAEDAVQNALYGIAVSFKDVPAGNRDAAHVYFLSCAKHAALRIQSTRQRIEKVEVQEEIEVSTGEDSTFEAVLHSENYEGLLRAIGQLDDVYQDVLLHYYVYNQQVKVIAKLFGQKPNTVRQHLSRGRRLLLEQCRKEGIVDG